MRLWSPEPDEVPAAWIIDDLRDPPAPDNEPAARLPVPEHVPPAPIPERKEEPRGVVIIDL